ncbi:MAG: carboxymuconolactone decarboxylase family protein [Myxococcota bacterium]
MAAQIPCEYCVYFHTKAAAANGASEREIKEAVGMAAVVRHWSTFLNGARIDEAQFQKDLDQVVANALAAAGKGAPPAAPMPTDAASAKADIRATLGFVPAFFEQFPADGLAGAWSEMKALQMSPATAIPPKYKELIGLAVAAQVPCHYCIAFHSTVAGKLLGASDAELREAVTMAAIVRHWSTVLNGMQIDRTAFRREVDRLLGGAKTGAR